MAFRIINGAVCMSCTPIDLKLALANTIANPIKAHVNGFGAFLFDGVSGDAAGCAVVGCHRRGGLGVTHFVTLDAEGTRVFAVVKEGAEFVLGSARQNFAHDSMAQDVHGAVGLGARFVKKKYTAARERI